MLRFPGGLTAERFLARHWQQRPLLMPAALDRLRPGLSRNELAWLATLPDVESRLVFCDRVNDAGRYTTESGPFTVEYLGSLPKRNWTLLVHDVEKHLPALRRLFRFVPFIPEWRIDDLMVSFAAPGGGVGPHRDNYDVFLCQGIGERAWRISSEGVEADADASADLKLLREFDGDRYAMRNGDVLYLPPGVAHWGTATRACMTYSIGMRAPRGSDLSDSVRPGDDAFFSDAGLLRDSGPAGYIPPPINAALLRLCPHDALEHLAERFGRVVTQPKPWLHPEPTRNGNNLRRAPGIHGMARLAWNDSHVFVNGESHPLPSEWLPVVTAICRNRRIGASDLSTMQNSASGTELLRCLSAAGAFAEEH